MESTVCPGVWSTLTGMPPKSSHSGHVGERGRTGYVVGVRVGVDYLWERANPLRRSGAR